MQAKMQSPSQTTQSNTVLSAKPYWRGNFSQQHHTDIPVYKGNPFRPPRDFQGNSGVGHSVGRMGESSSISNSSVLVNSTGQEQPLTSGNKGTSEVDAREMRS